MNGPKAIRKVILTGQSLSLEEFVAVARFGASVELALTGTGREDRR